MGERRPKRWTTKDQAIQEMNEQLKAFQDNDEESGKG